MNWTKGFPQEPGLYLVYGTIDQNPKPSTFLLNAFRGACGQIFTLIVNGPYISKTKIKEPYFIKVKRPVKKVEYEPYNHKTFPGEIGDVVQHSGNLKVIIAITYDGLVLMRGVKVYHSCYTTGNINIHYKWSELADPSNRFHFRGKRIAKEKNDSNLD